MKADSTVKDNVRGERLTAGWNLDELKGILRAFQAAWTCDCLGPIMLPPSGL